MLFNLNRQCSLKCETNHVLFNQLVRPQSKIKCRLKVKCRGIENVVCINLLPHFTDLSHVKSQRVTSLNNFSVGIL